MQHLGITSFRELSRTAGVSKWQIKRLRQGYLAQMRLETLLKLSKALQMPVSQLLAMFSSNSISAKTLPQHEESALSAKTLPRNEESALSPNTLPQHEESVLSPNTLPQHEESVLSPNTLPQHEESELVASLRQEYQRLQQQLESQRETLMQEFQLSSLQVLESWLVFWPSAAHAARQNQQLPAVKLLPLMRPIEQLLQQWGIEAIASIDSEIPYDPQQHQLIEGSAQPGKTVRVRNLGYRQGEKLLYRAKVIPITDNN
ncbi:MAG: helix-turn-helix domain-containing protein [Symploca sp. SIO2B6]|nr:helix-turn-helix domain-containing protein [Symploca sp. SIO2B6]